MVNLAIQSIGENRSFKSTNFLPTAGPDSTLQAMIKPTHAVVIGRFMPPHNGHRYLIDFATSLADRTTVFLCTLSHEPIPGDLRYSWMTELFPKANIIHITEEIPEANRNNPDSPNIWARSLKPYLPDGVDFLIASEDYGWDLAQALGARFVPVDPGRNHIGVSATLIRERPLEYWEHIPQVVRPYFARIIAVETPTEPAGVDSLMARLTGKLGGTRSAETNTGLAADAILSQLAQSLNTLYLPLYHEHYQTMIAAGEQSRNIHNFHTTLNEQDLVRAQRAQFQAMLRLCNRFLFVPAQLVGTVIPRERVYSTITLRELDELRMEKIVKSLVN